MAALPYIQLYTADYLADTAHLSTLEHGAYLLLIFNYWQRGESFRAKDKQTLNKRLATVARLSIEEWGDVADTLSEFFIVTETEWMHRRIEDDLAAVLEKSIKASAAGKASADKRSRKSNGRTIGAEQALNECTTNAQQSFNHTDTDTDTDISECLAREKTEVDLSPASVCIFLRENGFLHTNPDHPDLLAAVGGGAILSDFRFAAVESQKKGKGFAYMLKIVLGKIEERKNAKPQTSKPAGQKPVKVDPGFATKYASIPGMQGNV